MCSCILTSASAAISVRLGKDVNVYSIRMFEVDNKNLLFPNSVYWPADPNLGIQ